MRTCKQSHLRCFVTVAELGSISAAAARLHRTPSAISMTVTGLEAQLGRPLFEAGSKTRLTPFGAYVFETAREQLKQFNLSMENIQAYARNDFGRVVIAAVPSFATRYLPGLLADFIGRYPQVVLSIRDDSSVQVNKLVEQGHIDVGIASPTEDSPTLQFRPLLSDPLGVVCSRSHPLAGLDRPLTWNDLDGHRFIANGTCGQIRAPEFRTVLASSDMDVQNTTSLLALVAAGFGITTLPRLAVPVDREDVAFIPTRYDSLQRTIGIVTSAGHSLSPAAAAFVDVIEDAFERKPG
ncbi:MAG: LysR family transcriptional regulator [Gammaproteobacteria bacterium]|nr:LysR family transcriptional regulator [Gammaproteobacteria bacterium]